MSIKQKRKLPVTFTVNDFVDIDDSRFLAITIDVLHTGLNFNGTIFEKDIVDACADSIKNTPILGYIVSNANGDKDFEGHEYKTIQTEDGEIEVYAGSAYGVIPESCNYRWIKKTSSDGIEREYFQVDGLLWTKFNDSISIFERDETKPQSMELDVDTIEYEELEDGTIKILNFKFDGCCLLSSSDGSIEPAMIDSVAAPLYTISSITKEIKDKLNTYFNYQNKNAKEKGGIKMPTPNLNYALNVMEKLDEIRALLDEHRYVDKWGYECGRYHLLDIQGEEIIVTDRKDHYRIFGITYSVEGDKITINFDSQKRKKTQYVDFVETNEGALDVNFEKIVSDVADYMQEQNETISQEKETAIADFTKTKAEYDEIKPKYDAYVLEEQKREKEATEAAKDLEFTKFDKHLSDNENYQKLKADRAKYTLQEIRNECSLMFTAKNLSLDYTNTTNKDSLTANIPSEKTDVEINPRYGVMDTK